MTIKWQLVKFPIDRLKDYHKNPRKLSKHDAEHLEQSLKKFGLIDKPIINSDGTIIGGHQRKRILKKMGYQEVECWLPDRPLTEKEIEELNIRLNRNTGEWDWDILANQWEEQDLLDFGFTADEMGIDVAISQDEIEEEKQPTTILITFQTAQELQTHYDTISKCAMECGAEIKIKS